MRVRARLALQESVHRRSEDESVGAVVAEHLAARPRAWVRLSQPLDAEAGRRAPTGGAESARASRGRPSADELTGRQHPRTRAAKRRGRSGATRDRGRTYRTRKGPSAVPVGTRKIG